MPKGLTRNSSPIQVSSFVTETAANTFATLEVDLTLNALDQEVFVVTQVNIDLDMPDADIINPGGVSAVAATLSSTARTSVGTIADSNVIAQARRECQTLVSTNAAYAQFYDREDPVFAPTTEDYIGIVATSNMHINIQGQGNTSEKACSVRVYGYRAKMDAAGYAALVQSQVLSA